jgi:hypothetical protein
MLTVTLAVTAQEQFEFLNVCQVHGFPKIMGVLTHLDAFRNVSKLRKRKKVLKQRFWTEIYQGAKLFYLSGLIHGRYPNMEVHNLARYVAALAPLRRCRRPWLRRGAAAWHVGTSFIAVMKYRPLVWRNTHPYVVADRVEDLTPVDDVRDNTKTDRRVALYGFVRGTHLKRGMKARRALLPGGQPPAHMSEAPLVSVSVCRCTCPVWATMPWPRWRCCQTRVRCQKRKRSRHSTPRSACCTRRYKGGVHAQMASRQPPYDACGRVFGRCRMWAASCTTRTLSMWTCRVCTRALLMSRGRWARTAHQRRPA